MCFRSSHTRQFFAFAWHVHLSLPICCLVLGGQDKSTHFLRVGWQYNYHEYLLSTGQFYHHPWLCCHCNPSSHLQPHHQREQVLPYHNSNNLITRQHRRNSFFPHYPGWESHRHISGGLFPMNGKALLFMPPFTSIHYPLGGKLPLEIELSSVTGCYSYLTFTSNTPSTVYVFSSLLERNSFFLAHSIQ